MGKGWRYTDSIERGLCETVSPIAGSGRSAHHLRDDVQPR